MASCVSSGGWREEDVTPVVENLLVDGMPTRLIKVGSIPHPSQADTHPPHPKVIFLVIPGNPGVADFYELFCQTLYQASGYTTPAWAVGHAGHSRVPHTLQEKLKAIDHDDEVYDLEQQIEHKMAFIEDHVPPGVQLVLIGHSVGCYIIVDVMRRMPHLNLLKAVLLFPTLEHIWDSPNGRTIGTMVVYMRWVLVGLCYINYYLSDRLKWRMIKWWFKGRKVAECSLHGVSQLTEPARVHNSTFMAADEMHNILQADYSTIGQYLNKFIMYYGAKDNWAPRSHYETMQRRFPEGDIRLCRRGLEHAFCLDSSELMADLVWNWLSAEIKEIHS